MSQNRTILVIDYDPRSIRGMVDPLTRAGYRVEVRNDGEAGLKAFHELAPALVLIEPMIPKIHGFQVCREIKNSDRGRDVPVVIATSFYRGRRHHLEARKNYGCDDYLEKPISESQLLERCGALMPVAAAVGVTPAGTAPEATATAGAMAHDGADDPRGSSGAHQASSASPPLEDLSDEEIQASLDDFLFDAPKSSGAATAPFDDSLPGVDRPLALPGMVPDALTTLEPEIPTGMDVAGPIVAPQAEGLETVGERRVAAEPVIEPRAGSESGRRSRLPIWIAVAAAACLLGGLAILWTLRDSSSTAAPAPIEVEATDGAMSSSGEGVLP